MLCHHSLSKARLISDSELYLLKYKNFLYVADNFDSHGYYIFNKNNLQKYKNLSPYVKEVPLYIPHIDLEKLKKDNKIPAEYDMVRVEQTLLGNAKNYTFTEKDQNPITISVPNSLLEEYYTIKSYSFYYVVYTEPLQQFDYEQRMKIYTSSNLWDSSGYLMPGFFKISDLDPSFMDFVNADISHKCNETILYHTF